MLSWRFLQRKRHNDLIPAFPELFDVGTSLAIYTCTSVQRHSAFIDQCRGSAINRMTANQTSRMRNNCANAAVFKTEPTASGS